MECHALLLLVLHYDFNFIRENREVRSTLLNTDAYHTQTDDTSTTHARIESREKQEDFGVEVNYKAYKN